MLSVQSMAHVLAIWINIVQDGISICLMTCRKGNNLEVLIRLLQALDDVWSNINSSVHSLLIRKVYLEHNIRILLFDVVNTVNQCLIHIEDGEFFLSFWIQRRWQMHLHMFHFIFFDDSDIVLNEL